MLIHNAQVTGSLILNGIDIGDITGSEVSIGALNSFSASINIYTGSNNTNINALQTFSSSILTYTASNDTTNNTQNSRLSSLETTSGSLLTASGSFSIRVSNTETTSSNLTTASSSFSTRVANNEATGSSLVAASASFSTRVANTEATASSLTTASGSFSTRTTNLETASGSFSTRVTNNESNISSLTTASGSFSTRTTNLETASGSFSTRVTNAESNITSLNSKTGSYATTGSNIFVGAQYISNISNAISFTSTGSLYTDGGMRVAKDMYVSGTAYFNNVTVFGTQSIAYISSSQLNIGTNIISVNTDTPSIRFGGLSVYDSGSTGLTGSMLWDSEDNQWIYSNPSGSTYDSAVFLVGPRNSGAIGSEVGISCNFLSKGNGLHHMTSSGIFEDGSRTCFYGNTVISSSGAACFGGVITGGSDVILSAANPFIYGGTAVGGAGISNNTGASYIRVYGANHATLPNRIQFVNEGSTSLLINNTGDTCFASNVCALNLVSRCNIRVGVNGGYAVISGPTTGAAISLGSNSSTFDRNLSLGLVGGDLSFSPILTINAQTGNVGIGNCTPDRRLYIADTSVAQGTFLAYNQCSTFCGTVIEGITDRTSNSAFNLMNLKSSTTSMFIVKGDGNVGIGTATPATLLANTSTRPANADGLSLNLSGLDWVVNGQGYAGTIWNTSATANNYNAGLLVRICSTDVTDKILDLESGGVNRFRMLGTGAATFSSTITGTTIYGSTAICSPVGKFTNCIDAGSGYFSGNVAINGTVIGTDQTFGGAYRTFAFGTNSNGFNRIFAANDTSDGLYLNAATCQGINFRVNGGGANVFSMTSTGAATFSSTITGTTIYGSTAICSPVGLFSGCIGVGTISPNAKLEVQPGSISSDACQEIIRLGVPGSSIFSSAMGYINFRGYDISNGVQRDVAWIGTELVPNLDASGRFGGNLVFRTTASGNSQTPQEKMRITSTGIACFACQVCAPYICVGKNAIGDTTNYGLSINRHGDLNCSHAYTTVPAFTIGEFSNAGPTSGLVDVAGIWNLSFGRYSHTMACAKFASLMFIGYDGAMGPLRVDGRGNMFVGYDRTAANGSDATFSLLVACGITAGSYQYCVPPSGGALFSGNVGIGTSSPNSSSPLHIKMCSNSNGDGIRIQAICSGASGSQPGIAFANVSDAKRYSISLDNTGDILQITNAAGANALQINQSSVACFSSQTCAPMFISTAGCMASNSVITYSVGGTMVGTTATYFDFPTWNDAGQGQMFEVKAFFDHFYNWGYGAHYYVFLTTRETLSQALTMFNCTTGNGGSWMAYKPDNTTLRVCKVAGTYVGGGAYWIQVTAKQP